MPSNGPSETDIAAVMQAVPGTTRDQAIAQLSQTSGGSGAPASASDPSLWWSGETHTAMEQTQRQKGRPTEKPEAGTHTTDITKTASEASQWLQDQWYNQTPEYKKVVDQMIRAGIVAPNAQIDQVQAGWNKILGLAVNSWNSSGAKISPFDYLAHWADLNNQDLATGKTHTSTSTSVNKTSAADIQGRYQGVAANNLGRDATPAELAAAASKVQGLESANPNVTNTTTTYDANGNATNSSSVTSGGLGSSGIDEALRQQSMSATDYGAYQAAGHLFPALLNAIGAMNSAGA